MIAGLDNVLQGLFHRGTVPAREATGEASRPISRMAVDRIAFEGPKGASEVGTAVNRAIAAANNGTVASSQVFTRGRIEGVWANDLSHENRAMDQVVAEIEQAQHEIRLENFVFDAQSEAGQKILDAIAERQRQIPSFRVFIAHNAGVGPGNRKLLDAFAGRGIDADVAEYHVLPSRSALHAKSFILDGRVGFVGGTNIQNHSEVDLLMKLRGDAIGTLLADFSDTWKTAERRLSVRGGRVLSGPEALPTAPVAERLEAAQQVPLTFLSKHAGEAGAPVDSDAGLIAALGAAKRSIRIATPNFNNPELAQAVLDAAKRGVKVQLELDRFRNEVTSVLDGGNNFQFSRDVWSRLPGDVRRNIDLRWYSADGHEIAPNHTKYMSVDGVWSYVGTQNLDNQSFSHSKEIGFGLDDATQTARLDALFEQHWATSVPAQVFEPPANRVEQLLTRFRSPLASAVHQ